MDCEYVARDVYVNPEELVADADNVYIAKSATPEVVAFPIDGGEPRLLSSVAYVDFYFVDLDDRLWLPSRAGTDTRGVFSIDKLTGDTSFLRPPSSQGVEYDLIVRGPGREPFAQIGSTESELSDIVRLTLEAELAEVIVEAGSNTLRLLDGSDLGILWLETSGSGEESLHLWSRERTLELAEAELQDIQPSSCRLWAGGVFSVRSGGLWSWDLGADGFREIASLDEGFLVEPAGDGFAQYHPFRQELVIVSEAGERVQEFHPTAPVVRGPIANQSYVFWATELDLFRYPAYRK